MRQVQVLRRAAADLRADHRADRVYACCLTLTNCTGPSDQAGAAAMTIISASGFLQALRESEVLTGEQLDRAARELASGCASATELADALVAGGLLTRLPGR